LEAIFVFIALIQPPVKKTGYGKPFMFGTFSQNEGIPEAGYLKTFKECFPVALAKVAIKV
jgi:hypothetical protein